MKITFLVFISCFMATQGCNQTLNPLKENTQYPFSIYGYLDASLDTQWVRITPVRDQLFMPPEAPDLQVTLEHLKSGQKVAMNDSLFVPGTGFNYLNFWTTMDIEHEQTYRLVVEGPDETSSRVTVTIPEDFTSPLMRTEISYNVGPKYSLFFNDTGRLVDLRTRWYVRFHGPGFEEKKMFSFSYKDSILQTLAYGYSNQIIIVPEWEEQQIEQNTLFSLEDVEFEVLHRQVFLASGGPDWMEEIPLLKDTEYALPNNISNVEGGLGYVFGISSKRVPYKTCHDEEGLRTPCPSVDPFW